MRPRDYKSVMKQLPRRYKAATFDEVPVSDTGCQDFDDTGAKGVVTWRVRASLTYVARQCLATLPPFSLLDC